MHRLTIIGLILALISITPASVFVCGSVLSPEIIFQLNDGHDFEIEIDCTPVAPTINFSAISFSNFMQTGFFAAINLMGLSFAGAYYLFENQYRRVKGCIVTPLTPPPTPV